LVETIPQSRRYRLVGKGYSICVAFLKLFEKIYTPLTAGPLQPFRADRVMAEEKRCELDRLCQRVCDDLVNLATRTEYSLRPNITAIELSAQQYRRAMWAR